MSQLMASEDYVHFLKVRTPQAPNAPPSSTPRSGVKGGPVRLSADVPRDVHAPADEGLDRGVPGVGADLGRGSEDRGPRRGADAGRAAEVSREL